MYGESFHFKNESFLPKYNIFTENQSQLASCNISSQQYSKFLEYIESHNFHLNQEDLELDLNLVEPENFEDTFEGILEEYLDPDAVLEEIAKFNNDQRTLI
mmetsp:Transcript_9637/g.9297  ORF Transcript_9637/g.9297 Transcript_9637/m.9297 type:complete len:101 (+) Transcript_9637:540-842(+)